MVLFWLWTFDILVSKGSMLNSSTLRNKTYFKMYIIQLYNFNLLIATSLYLWDGPLYQKLLYCDSVSRQALIVLLIILLLSSYFQSFYIIFFYLPKKNIIEFCLLNVIFSWINIIVVFQFFFVLYLETKSTYVSKTALNSQPFCLSLLLGLQVCKMWPQKCQLLQTHFYCLSGF